MPAGATIICVKQSTLRFTPDEIRIGICVTDTAVRSGAFVRRIRGGLNTPLAHSAVAVIVVGVFSILFYVSYAALIFSGPLTPWLAYGLTATFITGAIGGAVTSWRSSLPFAIGGPDGSTCAVRIGVLQR